MQPKSIVGIDVSKQTLDVCIKPSGIIFCCSNDSTGFKQLKNAVKSMNVLIVIEHTGLYSLKLERFLQSKLIPFCKVPALQIKRSMGVIRGKNDKVDAARIAEYGWLRKDQLVATETMNESVIELRTLLRLRAKLVKDRSGYISRTKELASADIDSSFIKKTHQDIIKMLSDKIRQTESKIQTIIKTDLALKKSFDLMRSIKGVGVVIAAYMIAYTDNFKKFRSARKFNCYAGLAPFKYESGTSIRSRARVSHLANKEIKTLLNLGACCAIRRSAELREYFVKRVSEGKSKMSCLNIVRSKIVARIFAVVKRQSPYQEFPIAA